MQILEFSAKEIPRGQDYLFESYVDFQKLEPYLRYPKIGIPEWKIAFVDISIKDARQVSETVFPDYIKVTILLKRDVLIKFLQENSKLLERKKSRWEKFLEKIEDFPILLDQKAASEIFKRCHGNSEKMEELLSDLKTMFYDVGCIQMYHVNAVSIREDKVYARDVIFALLLKDNPHIPMKGSRLSMYKYKHWRKLYDELYKELGTDIAFYSLRKAVAKLYEEKNKYLNNDQVTSAYADIVEVVDVYELMHAHIAFQTANTKQSEVILRIIEGRLHNATLFEGTILSYFN